MRQELQQVQNRSLKAVLQKSCKSLEDNISNMRQKLAELKDHIIPVVLGAFSVAVCAIYVCATSDLSTVQNVLMAVFVAVVQGLLLAGGSVYVNQIIKQAKKEEK